MYPISLDLSKIPVCLIGHGEAFEKRKRQLREAGATQLFCQTSESGDSDGMSLWLAVPDDICNEVKIIMVAGLSLEASRVIAENARAMGVLVNVEDVNELCDFYFMAQVRRGDLLVAVSTNGASPTVAKRVRDKIAGWFGTDWADKLEEMKRYRLQLRAEGKNMKEVMQASEQFLDEKGWL